MMLQMQDIEKRQVFQELAEEEVREAQEARIRQELQVAIQKRIDLRLAMAHQQRERVLQLQREANREQQLRQEVIREGSNAFPFNFSQHFPVNYSFCLSKSLSGFSCKVTNVFR